MSNERNDVNAAQDLRRFLKQCETIYPFVHFTVANELGVPSEVAELRQWCEMFDRMNAPEAKGADDSPNAMRHLLFVCSRLACRAEDAKEAGVAILPEELDELYDAIPPAKAALDDVTVHAGILKAAFKTRRNLGRRERAELKSVEAVVKAVAQ